MDHNYDPGNYVTDERIDQAVDLISAAIESHAKTCTEERCGFTHYLVAFMAHKFGMRSTIPNLCNIAAFLHMIDDSCPACQMHDPWDEHPPEDWGRSADYVDEYWTWRESANHPPEIVLVKSAAVGVFAQRKRDTTPTSVDSVANEWGGLFGPRVLVDQ